MDLDNFDILEDNHYILHSKVGDYMPFNGCKIDSTFSLTHLLKILDWQRETIEITLLVVLVLVRSSCPVELSQLVVNTPEVDQGHNMGEEPHS